MGDEREAEMLGQVIVVPEKRLFLNPRNVTRGTKSLDDSILLIEFRSGFGNGLGAVPMGIGNGGELQRLTSMSIAVHFLCPCFTKQPRFR
jgi:hypothetical protein